ncbi:MAG: hypothetical protein K9H49_01140 [Bacteroidales bacterium]|nr:hypothetical protein [Bacteroidales bacterium]MCF8403802.1 hypothetical protein [Bacteroidales bacterium]
MDNSKTIAIISYITLIGWIVAIIMHSNNRSELGAFHLRQSLGLFISAIIFSFIPIIGWFLNIVIFAFIIVGLIYAAQEEKKTVPFVGDFYQSIFSSIN